jgi:hypothetical protein
MRHGCLSFEQLSNSAALTFQKKYFDYSKVKLRCLQATVAFLLLLFFETHLTLT